MATVALLLERVIKPSQGDLSPDHARYVLSLGFSPEEQARYEELAYKVRGTDMAPDERVELEKFVNVNMLLMLLKSKARLSLKRNGSAA